MTKVSSDRDTKAPIPSARVSDTSGLPTARTLFALPQGVTRIEIKLSDLNAADTTALRIAALTGLDALPWTDGAEQLMEALDA